MSEDVNHSAALEVCRPAGAMEGLPGGRVLARAPGKLNLALHVGPVRADGFHPLDSVTAKISFYDDLEFTPRDDGRVTLACDETSLGPVEDNLVMRAARAIQPRAAGAGVDIILRKRIPAGAGLGGGSADAAVTLRVLNEMWGCGLTEADLAETAATLGSDVPLTLGPPAARMRGRGEILDPLEMRPFFAVLVTPPAPCPTGPVYGAYDDHPRPLTEVDVAVFRDRLPSGWSTAIRNDLFDPARRVCPAISAWVERLESATGEPVHMTGSGSALFILADELAAACAVGRRLPADAASVGRIVSLNPW